MADLNDLTQNVNIWDDAKQKSVTVTTDGSKERLDVNAAFSQSPLVLSEITTSQLLSSAAMNFTTSIAADFNLVCIIFHATAPFTQEITVSLDSLQGANYDTVICKKTTSSTTDVTIKCCNSYKSGDELKIEVANSGTPSTTIYAQIIVELR